MKKEVLGLLLAGVMLVACGGNERLEYALQFAAENRAELEKVLEHYQEDKVKYAAACFLIENMPRYYSYQNTELDSLRATLVKYEKQKTLSDEEIKHWGSFAYEQSVKVYDAHVVKGDYLIAHIEHAFRMWRERPWNKHLSFDDFCELLLPYRVLNEPLEPWREVYEERYGYLLDSVYTGNDVIEATNVVAHQLRQEGFLYYWKLRYPHLPASFLLQHRVGTCLDACDLALYVYRSLGIPIAIDEYVYSSETRKSHTWNAVRDTTGHYVGFWFSEQDAIRDSVYSDLRKAGKSHRLCFGAQMDKIRPVLNDKQVPTFFKHPYLKDASVDYYQDTVCFAASRRDYGKYAYLGVFNPHGWRGIDMATIHDGVAVFPHVEPKVVYAPLSYQEGTYRAMDYPFYFDGKQNIPYVPDLERRDTVRLLRKQPLFWWIRSSYMDMSVGAVMHLAADKDFRNVNFTYRVAEPPAIAYNVVRMEQPVACRYLRYQAAADKKVSMAELHAYSGGKRLEPVSIGGALSPNAWGYENLLDNDPLTFCGTPEGDRVIIDYGRMVSVDSIVWIPRNDDNFIRIGDEYELFYHGGRDGWVSLGRKVATEPWLIYDNMPRGALFHLRCLTRGEEEQAFHLEEGEQVFVSNQALRVRL